RRGGAAEVGRLAARARPGGERRAEPEPPGGVDAGVARRGAGPHRRERPRLRLAQLLEELARRYGRLRRRRTPPLDRALDEQFLAARARLELGRPRLVVLAVDGLH